MKCNDITELKSLPNKRSSMGKPGFSPRQWQLGVWTMFELAALSIDHSEEAAECVAIMIHSLAQSIPCDPCRMFLAQAVSTFPISERTKTTADAVNFVYDLRAIVAAKINATRSMPASSGKTVCLAGIDQFPERCGYVRRVVSSGAIGTDNSVADSIVMMALRVKDAPPGSEAQKAKAISFALVLISLRTILRTSPSRTAIKKAVSRAVEAHYKDCRNYVTEALPAALTVCKELSRAQGTVVGPEFEMSTIVRIERLRGPASIEDALIAVV